MVGREKLNSLIGENFDEIAERMPEDAVVGAAMVIFEIRSREKDFTSFFTISSDRRMWVQRAMLREASEVIEHDVIFTDDLGDEV